VHLLLKVTRSWFRVNASPDPVPEAAAGLLSISLIPHPQCHLYSYAAKRPSFCGFLSVAPCCVPFVLSSAPSTPHGSRECLNKPTSQLLASQEHLRPCVGCIPQSLWRTETGRGQREEEETPRLSRRQQALTQARARPRRGPSFQLLRAQKRAGDPKEYKRNMVSTFYSAICAVGVMATGPEALTPLQALSRPRSTDSPAPTPLIAQTLNPKNPQ
jgi:hypothetical protein